MNKSAIAFASLLIIGAGGLAYRQIVNAPSAPSSQSQDALSASTRSIEEKTSRFAKLVDPSIRWQVRVDMLRRMEASSLSSMDIETLFSLLNHQAQPSHERKWWIVVNEIMEQMRKQGIGQDRYTETLLAIIENPQAHEVLRDYAVQHLGMWVTPRGEEVGYPSEKNPTLVKETAQTFGRIIEDPTLAHTSIPGTTLMSFIDMQNQSGQGVPLEILDPVLENLTPWLTSTINGETNTGKLTRISAITAVGMLGRTEHRSTVRELAQSEDIDDSIRLNSIASLGHLGEEQDLAMLETLAQGSTKYRFAAETALKNLTQNLSF